MKLSFSTLGCPDWSIEHVVARGQEYGFDGLEIRGIQREFDFRQIPIFNRDALPATKGLVEDAGLDVMVLGLSCRFSSPDEQERQENLESAYHGVKLAQKLGAPYVRVFGGSVPPEVKKDDAVEWVGDCLRALAEYGEDRGVAPLLETHDSWILSRDVGAVIERADHRNAGIIWDVRHTFHAGESFTDTFSRLQYWIRHVHIKDEDPDGYCLLGQGRVPNREAMRLLLEDGYAGYFSLEWEKAWQPDLAEPEAVFPQYVSQMRAYRQELGLPGSD